MQLFGPYLLPFVPSLSCNEGKKQLSDAPIPLYRLASGQLHLLFYRFWRRFYGGAGAWVASGSGAAQLQGQPLPEPVELPLDSGGPLVVKTGTPTSGCNHSTHKPGRSNATAAGATLNEPDLGARPPVYVVARPNGFPPF